MLRERWKLNNVLEARSGELYLMEIIHEFHISTIYRSIDYEQAFLSESCGYGKFDY